MASVAKSTGEDILTRDELFDVLGNERRRCIVQYIISNGDAIELEALVDHVAAWENEKSIDSLTRSERKRVYTALKQTHLPKMEEFGLIQFDSDRNIVRTAEKFSELDVYLQVVGGRIPYSSIYLIISSVSLLTIVGAAIGVPVLSRIPPLVWGPLLVALFGLTALTHWYQTRRMELVPDLVEGDWESDR